MVKKIKIQGVTINLDNLKEQNPSSLKKTDLFVHLKPSLQEAAYEALQKEYDAYTPDAPKVTVEKVKEAKPVKAEKVAAPVIAPDKK